MNIELIFTLSVKKFGTTLVSRQTGKEAFLAFGPLLREVKESIFLAYTSSVFNIPADVLVESYEKG